MEEPEQDYCADRIYTLIENNELTLPTLPDVATRVGNLIDDPNVSADKVVSALSSDPAITTQIIRGANSAAFAGKPQVDNIRTAVARLGYKQLRNIVLTVTMGRLLRARSPLIKKHIEKFWSHSREVAAISYVLALHQKHLNPDQAMLAGLIHDIGAIPLYSCADNELSSADEKLVDWMMREFKVPVGIRLLRAWNFPQDMIDVVAEHKDPQRASSLVPLADYPDVIAIANMLNRPSAKFAAWENMAAAQRLGMAPDDFRHFPDRFANQLAVAYDMLGIGSGTQAKAPQPAAAPPLQPAPARQARNDGLLASFRKKFFAK